MMSKRKDLENKLLQIEMVAKVNALGIIILTVLQVINSYIILIFENRMPGYGYWRIFIMLLIFILSKYLLKHYSHKLTASIFIFTCISGFFIFPLFPLVSKTSQNLFALLFIYVVISCLPYILFHVYHEKKWVLSWSVAMFVSFSLATVVLSSRLISSGSGNIIEAFYTRPMIIAAFFVALIFIQYLIYNHRMKNFEQQVTLDEITKKLNAKIKSENIKNIQLLQQKNEMIVLKNALIEANKTLEAEVKKRTNDIVQRNQETVTYGFMNSHLLCAPIARLKGLLYLANSMPKTFESESLIDKIKISINEIDQVSKEIDEVLNEKSDNLIESIEARVKQLYGSV